MRRAAIIVAVVLGVMFPVTSSAEAISFNVVSGSLSATATFEINASGNLEVVLTNTSTADALVPADILTAVFFDIAGVGALTPISALLSLGSTVLFDSAPGGNVGGEWAYASGLAGAPLGATEGISSSGLGLFGNYNFSGTDLDSPNAVNGLNYGITSAGDISTTGNSQVIGSEPLIKNSVTFILSGDFTNVDLSSAVTNVSFQYGTSLTEPNIRVPEPSSLLLFTVALGALGIRRRRMVA